MRELTGDFDGKGLSIGIVVSRFNDFMTQKLLDGALDALSRHGVAEDDILVARVPGAFEIPLVAGKMAGAGACDAVICLGTVIRGSTPHFEYIASEVAKGVARVGATSGVPTIFGVITTDTIEQAIERAGSKMGNKGAAAALDAIEMANLLKKLQS